MSRQIFALIIIAFLASSNAKGDYTTWQPNQDGTITITWNVTDGTGALLETLNVTASSCTSSQGGYATQTCTVSASSCQPQGQSCGASDAPAVSSTFNVYEVPNFAFYTYGLVGGSTGNQIHAGYVFGQSCTPSWTGTQVFVYNTFGNAMFPIFGLTQANNTLTSVTGADFGMTSSTCNSNNTATGLCTSTPAITYVDQGNGQIPISSTSCSNGVNTVTLGNNLGTLAAAQTLSGVLVTYYPSGQGGALSVPLSQAATLSDIGGTSGKTFSGLVLPSTGFPYPITIQTSLATNGSVSVSYPNLCANSASPLLTNPTIVAAGTTTGIANPGYPDFTAAPGGAYSTNALSSLYPNPATIPGLFVMDGGGGLALNRIIFTAYNYNGQTFLIGTLYNWQSSSTNGNGEVTNGQVVLFENSNSIPSGSCIGFGPCYYPFTNGALLPSGTLSLTPYSDASKLAGISRDYSNGTSPWGGVHYGWDINSSVDQAPYQAVTDGTLYVCAPTQNADGPYSDWQIPAYLVPDVGGGTAILYNMEPLDSSQTSITNQTDPTQGYWNPAISTTAPTHVTAGTWLFSLVKFANGSHVHFSILNGGMDQSQYSICPSDDFSTGPNGGALSLIEGLPNNYSQLCY